MVDEVAEGALKGQGFGGEGAGGFEGARGNRTRNPSKHLHRFQGCQASERSG